VKITRISHIRLIICSKIVKQLRYAMKASLVFWDHNGYVEVLDHSFCGLRKKELVSGTDNIFLSERRTFTQKVPQHTERKL